MSDTAVIAIVTGLVAIAIGAFHCLGNSTHLPSWTRRKNKDKHASADEEYLWVTMWEKGQEVHYAFTEEAVKAALERAEKNKEDLDESDPPSDTKS